jgi:hypothetical protein
MAREQGSTPQGLEEMVESRVEAALNSKINEYKKIARAFLAGLGLLTALVVGHGLLSGRSLLVMLHDEVFGFEGSLAKAMSNHVAVSYNNQFVLGSQANSESAQAIAFFAKNPQRVQAFIQVSHFGTGDRRSVSIWLDDDRNNPMTSDTKDFEFAEIDLTEAIRDHQHRLGRPKNFHFLNFDIDESLVESDDRAFVHVLINVLGREEDE